MLAAVHQSWFSHYLSRLGFISKGFPVTTSFISPVCVNRLNKQSSSYLRCFLLKCTDVTGLDSSGNVTCDSAVVPFSGDTLQNAFFFFFGNYEGRLCPSNWLRTVAFFQMYSCFLLAWKHLNKFWPRASLFFLFFLLLSGSLPI